MDKSKEWEDLIKNHKQMQIPENGLEKMMEAIERAKKDKAARKKVIVFKRIGGCIAAAFLVAVILPNVNANVAMAMEKIPVIGALVRVVTFGRYDFEDENHEAKVEIPKVEVDIQTQEPVQPEADAVQPEPEAMQSVDSLNKDIEDYINPIVEEFELSLSEEAKKALLITYDVVTDSEKWFTLRINVLEIQASGYEYNKYYHIDKLTGKRMNLGDIFRDDADYVGVISEEIKSQMREQMSADEGKIYFLDSEDMPDSDFTQIKPDQNFYFNDKGEIVIAFDEYEVAPGYMGRPEFVIPLNVTESIIK